ncbi:MAG: sulfatase-like hydrolase/transferase [Planctomycetes bacterium]|nr:sulfatase-like hydrolase/transferase [Planctomycetota bacterium]
MCSLFLPLEANSKPNIILIMADDHGYECIGANGSEDYKTPVLDSLAASGARFTNCFANPLCTPSRVKIMTGQYNVRNYRSFGVLDREQKTFAHTMKENGYRTAVAGKWQLGREPDSAQHFGFEKSCLWNHVRKRTKGETKHDSRFPNPHFEINGKPIDYNNGEYGPDICTDFITDFIEKHQNEPFLAYYPMLLTHCPFVPSIDHEDYDPSNQGSETYKGDAKYFQSMVEYVDTCIGKIVKKLEDLNLRDNTIIIFTGDNGTDQPVKTNWNGIQVSGGKGSMKDAGTRVPLIINSPKWVNKGIVSDELVELSDIFPTLCDYSKASKESQPLMDGVSLYPSLTGKDGRYKPHIFIWYGTQVLARSKNYMMIRNKYDGDPVFYDASKPFERVQISTLTEKYQAPYEQLLKVIEDKVALRPADYKVKDLKNLARKAKKIADRKALKESQKKKKAGG